MTYLIAAAFLSACGAGTSQTTLSQTSSFTAPSATPTASTGFARASDSITNVAPKTSFSFSSREVSFFDNNLTVSPFETTALSGKFISPTEIELTVSGKTYALSYNASNDSFSGRKDGKDVSVFIADMNTYAAIATASLSQSSSVSTTGSVFTGVIGYSSDPTRLPARATYNGLAALSAIPELGTGDTSTGTVTMDANFTNGTIAGTINLTDATGDTTGPVDLGNMSITFDHPFRSAPPPPPPPDSATTTTSTTTGGIITGNSFTADLNISSTDLLSAGIYGDPNLQIEGGFYGPTGEHAVGIATGTGRTVGASGTQDVLLNLSVNAAK